jgi:hypothetical protein
MNTPELSLAAVVTHLFLSAGIAYACFCRLTKTDKTTPITLRTALFLTANVSLLFFAAPFFWGMQPSWWTDALLGTVLLSKIVSSELWRDGVPQGYLHKVARPCESSKDKFLISPLFTEDPLLDNYSANRPVMGAKASSQKPELTP